MIITSYFRQKTLQKVQMQTIFYEKTAKKFVQIYA